MWKCSECGEVIEDQFEECWRCGTVLKREKAHTIDSTLGPQTGERKASSPTPLHTMGRGGFPMPGKESSYKYKFVQLPCCIDSESIDRNTALAEYLQTAVDRLADQGWEFVRIDTLPLSSEKSRAASERKSNQESLWYSVICFRRPRFAS
jgi:hypothetical protein